MCLPVKFAVFLYIRNDLIKTELLTRTIYIRENWLRPGLIRLTIMSISVVVAMGLRELQSGPKTEN